MQSCLEDAQRKTTVVWEILPTTSAIPWTVARLIWRSLGWMDFYHMSTKRASLTGARSCPFSVISGLGMSWKKMRQRRVLEIDVRRWTLFVRRSSADMRPLARRSEFQV
ncbi:putative lipoprotein [Burkholderia pseudomallei]|nr:putative lipoprotein [Burkholderia pseudomallei]KGW98134.1 putative lipoprotein [Burkholderia pseudomallei MSHR456]